MSRKALFANLNLPTEKPPQNSEAPHETMAPASSSRARSRPLLGSTELLTDPATTPVGALGKSLSEFKAKTDRAVEIERKLAEGQAVADLDLSDMSRPSSRIACQPPEGIPGFSRPSASTASRSPFLSGPTQTDPADTRLLMGIAGSGRSRSWGGPSKRWSRSSRTKNSSLRRAREQRTTGPFVYPKGQVAHRLQKGGFGAIR